MTIDKSYAGGAVPTAITGSMSNSVPGVGQTFAVSDATGYPASDPFVVVISRDQADEEKILISSRSGTTFTVGQRGYDGTTAQGHATTAVLEHELDALTIQSVVDHVNDIGDDHQQYLDSARHDVEARHIFGTGKALGVPAAAADVGTTPAAGTGDNPAREDHVHQIGSGAIDDFAMIASGVRGGAPAAVNAATLAAAAGSVDKLAREDHVHMLTNGAISWTPVLSATGSAFTGTITAAGYYFQIGKQVWCYVYVAATSISGAGTGSLQLTLPATMQSTLAASGSIPPGVPLGAGIAQSNSVVMPVLFTAKDTTHVLMYRSDVAPVPLAGADIVTGDYVRGSFMFIAA